MTGEFHLFILWERANECKQRILDDIADSFTVIQIIQGNWPKRSDFLCNLQRFYGAKLPPWSGKARDCGTGPFVIVIVRDESPAYDYRLTSRGNREYLNVNLFDKKQQYRSFMEPATNSRIHCTNTPDEMRHDFMLLFGKSVDCLSSANPGLPPTLTTNIVGDGGWDSLTQMFSALNATAEYVILRNTEYLPDAYRSKEHGDIDLLVRDRVSTAKIMNARRIFGPSYRVQYECAIRGEKVLFDLREVGDGYYDKSWQDEMLKTRRFDDRGFYTLNDDNYRHSLLYHALVHKKQLSNDYAAKLFELFDSTDYQKTLHHFMHERGISFTEPNDITVYLNPLVTGRPMTKARARHFARCEAAHSIRSALCR